jgi:hypothetical protein
LLQYLTDVLSQSILVTHFSSVFDRCSVTIHDDSFCCHICIRPVGLVHCWRLILVLVWGGWVDFKSQLRQCCQEWVSLWLQTYIRLVCQSG